MTTLSIFLMTMNISLNITFTIAIIIMILTKTDQNFKVKKDFPTCFEMSLVYFLPTPSGKFNNREEARMIYMWGVKYLLLLF